MNRKILFLGIVAATLALCAIVAAVYVFPHEPDRPVVYIVYDTDKGDLSYTDSTYAGLFSAQEAMRFDKKEFVSTDPAEIGPAIRDAPAGKRPGLVITLGYAQTGMTEQLAREYPGVRFLAIDQSGIGSGNVRAYEITSYGDSYLAGVLAASATKTGRIGIIPGTQAALLDTFRAGYRDGARAVRPTIAVDEAYVRDNSTAGFYDPDRAAEIARGMYGNGADVIYMAAGYSNTGIVRVAKEAPGRYVIGTDSDQTSLGPGVVLASAVKRLDRVVYQGIGEYLGGSFSGGGTVAGLSGGTTGLVFNPRFENYNGTVRSWEAKAEEEEARYLATRAAAAQG